MNGCSLACKKMLKKKKWASSPNKAPVWSRGCGGLTGIACKQCVRAKKMKISQSVCVDGKQDRKC